MAPKYPWKSLLGPMQGWESEWGGGVVGGGEKKSMSFRFRFSNFQIFDFRFLVSLEIFSEKYVGEISRNK